MSKKKRSSDAISEDVRIDTGKTKKVSGRPRADIDFKKVRQLGAVGCTIDDIATILEIPASTLRNRPDFATVYKKAVEEGKSSLRKNLFNLASHNAAAAIFLAKNWLGMKDIPDPEPIDTSVEIILAPKQPADFEPEPEQEAEPEPEKPKPKAKPKAKPKRAAKKK